ncbi:MAG: site-specific integrase [Oscillospiraceae bacterium]|nr:site-specific integrase [Oscillospiraceae bacterium]
MGLRTNTAQWLDKYQRWQIKVQKDGERKTFYSSRPGRAGQRECNAKADAWLDGGIQASNKYVRNYFEQWLQELEVTTGTAHHSQYSGYWRTRIKPKIGNLKLDNLTEQHLQAIINQGHKDGLAKKTLMNIRSCLVAFIKYARKCKATNLHPEDIYIPRGAKVKEKKILQPDGIKTLFTKEDSLYLGKVEFEPLVFAWRMQVLTGLRPGELLGLRWDDINFKSQTISIKKSINRFGEETTGKNENARRKFKMMPLVKDLLLEYKKRVSVLSQSVFNGRGGEPLSQSVYYTRWGKYQTYNNIPKISLYEIRHTFVSIFKDLPEGLMKPIIGHSVNMDTYGTYGHEVTDDMERAASLMSDRFKKIVGE